MSKLRVSINLEDEDGSAYLNLRDGKVAKTRRLAEKVNLDLGADGEVMGVEFIFHSLRTADISMFQNQGIPSEDLLRISRLLSTQRSKFSQEPAGVWRIPKSVFQFSAPQPAFL